MLKDGRLSHGLCGIQGVFGEDSARLLQPLYRDAITGKELSGEGAEAA